MGTRPRFEVADVIKRFGPEFVRQYGRAVTSRSATVLTRIQHYRTAALGGHNKSCSNCGASEISYNSCRDRHCPKCGGSRRAKWLAAQSETLLELSASPKHMGARIGVTSMLHTWGQNLEHHPHIHCVVTGGG